MKPKYLTIEGQIYLDGSDGSRTVLIENHTSLRNRTDSSSVDVFILICLVKTYEPS